MINPTEHLLGLTLEDGWLVTEKIVLGHNHSGGNFSIGYKVKKDDQIAFMKAFDVSRAMESHDFMAEMQKLTNAYQYEKELLLLCDGKRMDKVVRMLAHSSVPPAVHKKGPTPVPYLIFELAETTARQHVLSDLDMLDNACLMRSLHGVAIGISQLHNAGIVHQDVKGSNVLLFDTKGACKLADLGRAELQDKPSGYFNSIIAGDPDYAPPEQQYYHVSQDWDERRKSTDLYLLGSLIVFYYTQDTMNNLYATHLPVELQFRKWRGKYEEILPDLKVAFQESLEYIEERLADRFSDTKIIGQIIKVIKHLCDPDFTKRGHPDNLPGQRYSMERYITTFDVLASEFEKKLI